LPALWAEAEAQRSSASGLAALRLAAEPLTWLLCFRPEIVREVHWGGDPNQPFERDEATKRISPRKSFALWRETVRGESRPWETPVSELLTHLPMVLAHWLPDPAGTLQGHIGAFGQPSSQPEPPPAAYLEGAAPEGMALLMVAEPPGRIRPLSVNQAFQDTFGLDFTALDGMALGVFLDALGLPRGLLSTTPPNAVIECDSWSDFRGQRNLLIERKRFLETQQAETTQSWAVLVFQDITDLSREREALRAAREHALLTAETLEQQVAERTRALQQEIAERKRAERELEQQRAHLEDLVRERTTHLSTLNQQLQTEIAERRKSERARERLLTELRRSNEALEHFAYIASHDLQEPVRKIRQFGERLLDDPDSGLPGKAHDYVGRIHHSATHAQQLIRDLLAYSRVTQRAQPFKTVALNEVLARVLSGLQQRAAEAAARIDVEPLPSAWGDRTQLIQLFHNLLDNALKFRRPDARPWIRIRCEGAREGEAVAVEKDGLCRITVTDNGIGFEPRFSEQIFTLFRRLHDRQHYAGTGIGLAICKKIVDYHGGSIEGRSTPGQGAVFTVTLPLRAAFQDADETPPAAG
jgi:signal transduction histidine kinase